MLDTWACVDVICRVQEIMGDEQKEAGRIPRTVDCELMEDLGEVSLG